MGEAHQPRGILVTGGAGFIGAHLVRRLLAAADGPRVVVLDKLTYAGDLARLADVRGHPRLEVVVGDIGDRALVDRLLAAGDVDTVMHLAAESHVDRSIEGPAAFIATNVVGTSVLLDACRAAWAGRAPGSVRFHHVSTDEVFGELGPDDPPFSPDTPYAPSSPYAASKAAADHLVRAWHRTYGLPVVLTNCSNNFGPGQHGEKFIPTVIRACLAGTPIPLYGDGMNVRDWLYVEDHAEALDLVMRRGHVGATYLIGGRCELPNREVVRRICSLMDRLRPATAPHERLVRFVRDRPGHDWRYAIDPTIICTTLGWQPGHAFDAALERTVTWYADRSAP